MLEENTNPNTNNQVPEGQCPSAGQLLAQRKRSQPADGQCAIPPLSDQKRRRQATLAKHRQNNSNVNVNKALRVNILEAVDEIVSEDDGNRNSRMQVGMTELLIFLMNHVRLDDGTKFKVDPANDHEITVVRETHAFFCTVAPKLFRFSDKIWEA